jgi:hypothetical protein
MVALFWLYCGLLERACTLVEQKQPAPARPATCPTMQA